MAEAKVQNVSQDILDEMEDRLNELYRLAYENKIPLFVLYEPVTEDHVEVKHKILTPHDLAMDFEGDQITRYAASLSKDIDLIFKDKKVTNRQTMINDALDDLINSDL